MLKKAICFLMLELIALSISAKGSHAASYRSELPVYPLLNVSLSTSYQFKLPAYPLFGTYKGIFKLSSSTLSSPKTGAKAWISPFTEGVNPSISLQQVLITPLIERKDRLNEAQQPQLLDLGYLLPLDYIKDCDNVHAGKRLDENEIRYAVNYDGGQLIYFGFSFKRPPHTNHLPKLRKLGRFLLTTPHHQKALKELEACILDKVLVNNNKLVEANHISMREKLIILDTKL